jgi:hypothetical protein
MVLIHMHLHFANDSTALIGVADKFAICRRREQEASIE